MIITEQIKQTRAEQAYLKILRVLGVSVRVIDPKLIKRSDTSGKVSHLIEITTDEPKHVALIIEDVLWADPDIKRFNPVEIKEGLFDWASDTYIKPAVYVEFLV